MRILAPFACALVVTAFGAAAADDGLGRLFHTPAERALLDAAREAVDLPAEIPGTTAGSAVIERVPPPAPPTAPVSVNGIVQRERGPSTAWINGEAGTRAELEAMGGGELRIGRGVIEMRGEMQGEMQGARATRARVKPGQVFDPVQGRVVESFERSVAPPQPAP